MPSFLRIATPLSAVVLLIAAGGYVYYEEHAALAATRSQLASMTLQMEAVQTTLTSTTLERNSLQDALTAEQNKNQTFEGQISQLSGTVGKLDQLSKTDPQLLAKYSKVYFLNENYVPSVLANIDPKYLFEPSRTIQIHAQIQNHLYAMLDAARTSGIDILVASGYRSFGEQSALKKTYKITYGAGTANSFSADQGYSEHQLGTALDFTTQKVGSTFG
ncbi:MAG: peptidase and DD-carboxypeptidase VanY/endolysin, partial [Parcubacteria group bacterium]|nr:peptidase and DD-carboxypeptidase VanY/endolysin [Parcubacteria group bacterium]